MSFEDNLIELIVHISDKTVLVVLYKFRNSTYIQCTQIEKIV